MLLAKTVKDLDVSTSAHEFELQETALTGERHYVTLEFFDGTGALVDKSLMTGSVSIMFSENGNEYGTINNGTVTLGASGYDRPHLAGTYEFIKVDFSAATGLATATTARLIVYTHE